MTVITVADEKYFEYLRVFCRSAAVNLSGVTIECTLVNCGKNHINQSDAKWEKNLNSKFIMSLLFKSRGNIINNTFK